MPSFCEIYVPHTLPPAALSFLTHTERTAWEDNLIAYEALCAVDAGVSS